ncbi:hypothetical protein L1987_62766 [Smallanthus sonchifolius]|uniref:Uncharacterized protein n=1 Tax=Smallanthus sonchifolius TaxID=185202 RepID=A0ACB9CBP5_9ASTR|nr:hypothetical protein L1987_62766 [Smallanthus sonchifolius]
MTHTSCPPLLRCIIFNQPSRSSYCLPKKSIGTSLAPAARLKMQGLLSDRKNRSIYDVGLYDPQEEEDEGFADFMQKMLSLMKDVKREEKIYSLGEIQSMFWEMARSYNYSASCFGDNGLWSTQEMFPLNNEHEPTRTRCRAWILSCHGCEPVTEACSSHYIFKKFTLIML